VIGPREPNDEVEDGRGVVAVALTRRAAIHPDNEVLGAMKAGGQR
jgi:hypothetical protein